MHTLIHNWLLPTLRAATLAGFSWLLGYGIFGDLTAGHIMAGATGIASYLIQLAAPWLADRWPEYVELSPITGNNEQQVDEPEDMPDTIYMPITANTTRVIRIPEWMDRFKLQMLVTGIRSGRPFTEAEWVGLDKPFTRDEFKQVREWMLRYGMARARSDKDPRQGFDVTTQGKRAFEWVAKEIGR
jgi:hypothetical protein